MEVILDGRRIGFEGVQHELKLMWQERILSQFFDGNGLGWFYHYQQTDIQRLEKILTQASDCSAHLSGKEKRWVDELQDFYDDFKRFDWDTYQLLPPEKRKEYELNTAIRWAKQLRTLTPIVREGDDPLYFLLDYSEVKYKRGENGVQRPVFITDTE